MILAFIPAAIAARIAADIIHADRVNDAWADYYKGSYEDNERLDSEYTSPSTDFDSSYTSSIESLESLGLETGVRYDLDLSNVNPLIYFNKLQII